MIEAKDIQILDDYRDGRLSDKERQKFENALKNDPELNHFLKLGDDIQRILRFFTQKPTLKENI
jgi:anti-sigma factor RsiW